MLLRQIVLTVIESFVLVLNARSYQTISPAQVHERLVKGDTLLLLDVREPYEYVDGHIAEPVGQLPLTPALMPWSSGALSQNYNRLPQNVDIIVYCRSGGRGSAAASFLNSKGFTRIYNMTGGFSSWTFEVRDGAFGDHSGGWFFPINQHPIEILCLSTGDTSKIVFPASQIAGVDSFYTELHFASPFSRIPAGISESAVTGTFRVTILDHFGLSLFDGDSVTFSDSLQISLFPNYKYNPDSVTLSGTKMSVFVPGKGCRPVFHIYERLCFIRDELILRKWYNVQGSIATNVCRFSPVDELNVGMYPNPFNCLVHIVAPEKASVYIFDQQGRFIRKLTSKTWIPHQTLSSGIYYLKVFTGTKIIGGKILYLK